MQHDEIMPNLQCLNAAIHALGLSGEWRRADAIMEVIWKSGMTPDVVSYNSIAMAYASVRKEGWACNSKGGGEGGGGQGHCDLLGGGG